MPNPVFVTAAIQEAAQSLNYSAYEIEEELSIFNIDACELVNLSSIGGHKVYHLEGNALKHTFMVVEAMRELFLKYYTLDGIYKQYELFKTMIRTAYLHDIGKIYTSIKHGDNDWEYPDHALCGSFRGILSKFYSEDHADFKQIQWYISNHIKPLFWMKKGKIETTPIPEGCSIKMLVFLAISDIKSSKSIKPQDELLEYLYKLL